MNILTHPTGNPLECPAALMAAKLSALAHPARLAILRYLSGNGACCCKEVVEQLDLAQSTVSQHLKILVEAGLVRFEPERPRSRYTVDGEEMKRLKQAVGGYLDRCTPNRC